MSQQKYRQRIRDRNPGPTLDSSFQPAVHRVTRSQIKQTEAKGKKKPDPEPDPSPQRQLPPEHAGNVPPVATGPQPNPATDKFPGPPPQVTGLPPQVTGLPPAATQEPQDGDADNTPTGASDAAPEPVAEETQDDDKRGDEPNDKEAQSG